MPNSDSNLIQNITDFIEVKIERIKLRLISATAAFFSTALSISLFIAIAFFMVFFFSFGIAYLLNQSLDSDYIGFLIVGSFYLLVILIVLFLFKRKIIQAFFESLLIKLMNSKEDEQEN